LLYLPANKWKEKGRRRGEKVRERDEGRSKKGGRGGQLTKMTF